MSHPDDPSFSNPVVPEACWGIADIGIPSEVLFHPELTETEKILFGFVRNLSQSSRGCWATNRWLGQLLNKGPQTISNSVNNLEKWGFFFIQYTKKPGTTNEVLRSIYINHNFTKKYRKIVRAANDSTAGSNTGAGVENLYRGIKTHIGGYKDSYNKDVNEDVNNIITLCPDFQSDGVAQEITSLPKRTRTAPPIQDIPEPVKTIRPEDTDKFYTPIAEQLVAVVESKKHITVSRTQIKNWSRDIRLLCKSFTVNPRRVAKALTWYADHHGDEYVPVIESGAALREKFLSLESAIERAKHPFRPAPSKGNSNNAASLKLSDEDRLRLRALTTHMPPVEIKKRNS